MLKISMDLKVINNIDNLIRCAKRICKNKEEKLEESTKRLRELYGKVKVIGFDSQIVGSAQDLAKMYELTGKW